MQPIAQALVEDQTAADCKDTKKDLKDLRKDLEKILGPDGMGAKPKPSPVEACLTQDRKDQQTLADKAAKAEAAGKLSPDDLNALKDIEGQLASIAAALNKKGLSLSDCADIGKSIAEQAKALTKLLGN